MILFVNTANSKSRKREKIYISAMKKYKDTDMILDIIRKKNKKSFDK